MGILGRTGRGRPKNRFWYDVRNSVKQALLDLELFILQSDRNNIKQVLNIETLKPVVRTLLYDTVLQSTGEYLSKDQNRAEIHAKFHFSQDDLEQLFRRNNIPAWGEINESILKKIVKDPFERRIKLVSLVLLCLGVTNNVREWIPIQQIIGLAKAYGRFVKIRVTNEEILTAIVSLQSTLLRLVVRNEEQIRLQGFPMKSIGNLVSSGNDILKYIEDFSKHLKALEKS